MNGSFYRVRATDKLPAELRPACPDVLWLPEAPAQSSSEDVALWGKPIAGGAEIALLSGGVTAHFDVAKTIDGILLERYHDGLEPTAEMKLPFNYSLLPNWVKGVGRKIRTGPSPKPDVAFPPGEPSLVVEWLRRVGVASGKDVPGRSLKKAWPNGARAAVTITHDVDTDWVFKNSKWLERILDIEKEHGFAGAWYCVPAYCDSSVSHRGIERLKERGAEVGCHGYNHDAKWPLLEGRAFDERLEAVRAFVKKWQVRGFRSEWLWRTQRFLEALAGVFDYDSSVPNVLGAYTRTSKNGCGTCFPYRTFGDLVELPITVEMDEWRHLHGLDPMPHWRRIVDEAKVVIDEGGVVVLSLHPQSHQAANDETLRAVDWALREIRKMEKGLWIARPDAIVDWAKA